MPSLVEFLFAVDAALLIAMLIGVVWSVAVPTRRIWPPPGRRSWPWWLTWICFDLAIGLNAALLVLDWNAWVFASPLRFVAGVPLALVGALLAVWGVRTVGVRNSLGLKDGFVRTGPYVFTRNPQYLGDILLFAGLSLIANSLYLWVAHGLLSLVFAITPLAEETWLEAQYGESYAAYKRETARFL